MKNYLLLLTLPLLVACSEREDEPYLAICPVEPREDVALTDLLNGRAGVQIATASVPFDASVDAIDTSGQYEVDEVYNYPNKPGYGSGWNALAPLEENLAKTQVPQDLVMKMTTRALVETCIEHPMALYYMHGEEYHRHFIERLIAQNNAFQELTKRPDAGWELAIAYNSLNYPNHYSGSIEDSNKNVYHIWGFLELMIENDKFFNQFTDKQLVELYKALEFKYYTKEQHYPLVFGLSPYDIGLTLLPLAKTLLKIGYFSDDSVKAFLQNYVKNWDPYITTSAEVLQAIALMTGSDMKVYEELDVNANRNLLIGTWKVKSYGYGEDWWDYEKDEAITFRADSIMSGNWLITTPGTFSIEGNIIKLDTGRKDEGGMAIDYRMKVFELTEERMLCYAWTTWILSSWIGNWFILEKVE
ncbi:MAG: lipocalin family protein [Bacteroidaceae bacterium]|nr:lipocalin family protein [Bacteroidaceae bacterium]